jgi:hypothetical protein
MQEEHFNIITDLLLQKKAFIKMKHTCFYL